MTEFEKALMSRDGMTKAEVQKERESAMQMLDEILSEGLSYDEIEDMLADEYGLEMDYVLDLI